MRHLGSVKGADADLLISPQEALLLKRYRLLRPIEQQLIQELLKKYTVIDQSARGKNRVKVPG